MAAQLQNISINLLPTEDLEKTPAGKFLKWALTVGRYIVIFTELIVLAAFFSRFYFDRKLSDLHEEIAQKQAIVQSASDLEKEARRIQGRLSAVKTILASDVKTETVIALLAKITPSNIVYNTVYVTNQSVTVTATTVSEASLATFLNNLRISKFVDVSLDSIEKNKNKGTGLNFTVSAKFLPQSFLSAL